MPQFMLLKGPLNYTKFTTSFLNMGMPPPRLNKVEKKLHFSHAMASLKFSRKISFFSHDKSHLPKGCRQKIAIHKFRKLRPLLLEHVGGMSSRGGRLHCDSSNLKNMKAVCNFFWNTLYVIKLQYLLCVLEQYGNKKGILLKQEPSVNLLVSLKMVSL